MVSIIIRPLENKRPVVHAAKTKGSGIKREFPVSKPAPANLGNFRFA
jgi:hypothetical protein